MESLLGGGLQSWSPAPQADTLSLALCFLLLGCPHCALAMSPCKEDEYPVGAECCPKCSPGFRVHKPCGKDTGTFCVPCALGTYTAHLNGLSECLQCRVCDPAMGLVTRTECSRTENTVCSCDQGHFCVVEEGDECAECRPHSVCRPGQQVQEGGEPQAPPAPLALPSKHRAPSAETDPRPGLRARGSPAPLRPAPKAPSARPSPFPGTEWQDTRCADCPPGTFSPNGTLLECQPWTKCSGLFQTESKPGTKSTDAACFSWAWILLCVVAVIVVVFVPWIAVKITRSRGLYALTRPCLQVDRDAAASQVLPDVTTMAVEETTSMVPERNRPSDKCLWDADV